MHLVLTEEERGRLLTILSMAASGKLRKRDIDELVNIVKTGLERAGRSVKKWEVEALLILQGIRSILSPPSDQSLVAYMLDEVRTSVRELERRLAQVEREVRELKNGSVIDVKSIDNILQMRLLELENKIMKMLEKTTLQGSVREVRSMEQGKREIANAERGMESGAGSWFLKYIQDNPWITILRSEKSRN